MIADRAIKRAPATICPRSRADVGGSVGLMRRRQSAEPTKDIASASNATGAVSSCTSHPPMLGPITNDIARLPFSIDWPSTN